MNVRKRKSLWPLNSFSYTLAFFIAVFLPKTSWAVQQHGGAEGLVSHQIGHILFIIGMLFLLYRLGKSSSRGSGWLEFKVFIWLATLWNCLTFYGHWHREYIDPGKFILVNNKVTAFTVAGPLDMLFYLSRLDHLLLVPAFLFLLLALAKWRRIA